MKKFEQLKRLYKTMEQEYAIHCDNYMFISAITSDFDRLFELAWKTLKEYLSVDCMMLEAKTGSPKLIIKLAYAENLLNDEDSWIIMLKDRNDDTHHYNESVARVYAARIEREYFRKIKELIDTLSEIIPEEPDCLCQIPESFLESVRESGMFYDEFLQSSMQKYGYTDSAQFFRDWEKIK